MSNVCVRRHTVRIAMSNALDPWGPLSDTLNERFYAMDGLAPVTVSMVVPDNTDLPTAFPSVIELKNHRKDGILD